MAPSNPSSRSGEQRLRQACDELFARVRAGDRSAVESILAQCPDLGADQESALELIYAEYVFRERFGDAPDPKDYSRRFPQWRQRVERLLDVHRALAQLAKDETSVPVEATPHGASLGRRGEQNVNQEVASDLRQIGPYELLEEVGSGQQFPANEWDQWGVCKVGKLSRRL